MRKLVLILVLAASVLGAVVAKAQMGQVAISLMPRPSSGGTAGVVPALLSGV